MSTTRPTLSDLALRVRGIADLLERQLETAPRWEPPREEIAHWDVAGVGASSGPAHLLSSVLIELGMSSRVLPISSMHVPGASSPGLRGKQSKSGLVIFSQGLSPNAQIALGRAHEYDHAVLFTAMDERVRPDRAQLLKDFPGIVIKHGPREESGSLVRFMGPMAASMSALQFAIELARQLDVVPSWASRLAEVPAVYRQASTSEEPWGLDPAACFAIGTDLGMAGTLMWKWQEALYTRLPSTFDVIAFAHGPLQAFYGSPALFLALRRSHEPSHDELWSRISRVLDPEQHRMVFLDASLPGPLGAFEFDALLNSQLMCEMENREVDPSRWPGQGRDGPLYSLCGPKESGLEED